MEIINEIKAKVMMQYWGQDLSIPDYFGYELEGVSGLSVKAFGRNNGMHELFKLEACKLILKPLSSITGEDAIEAVKHFGDDPFVFERTKHSIEVCFFNRGAMSIAYDGVISDVGNSPTKNGFNYFLAYQLLQYKGYDLPHYLLGGATLKEAGLAIYEEDLK